MYLLLLSILASIVISICLFLIGLYHHAFLSKERKVKIVVAENNGGQLCNQLWHFARLAAFCKERGYECYNPAFYHYAPFFEHFYNDILISSSNPFYLNIPFLEKIRKHAYHALRFFLSHGFAENRYYFNDHNDIKSLDNNFPQLKENTYLFFDWNFSNDEGMKKHRDYLTELLKPRHQLQKAIDTFWNEIEKNRLNIGVHVRHGDFRRWRQGSHFFSIEKIFNCMEILAKEYQKFNPLFIIYSNEERHLEEFFPLEVKISKGNHIYDLYSMARCDIIVGTRFSTFNEWAAWYGNRERFCFEDFPNIQFDKSKFKKTYIDK